MSYNTTYIKPFGVCLESKDEKISVDTLDRTDLRRLFKHNHLVVLRGFTTFHHAQQFSEYCETWGEVSIWPFGTVLELIQQEDPQDHIFDSSYVPLHWDGMYRRHVPEYQIFHCVKAPLPGKGGRTIFSNTKRVLDHTSPEQKALWGKVTGVYERKMAFYDSKTISPLISKHPRDDFSVIRYNALHFPENGELVNPPNVQLIGITDDKSDDFHRNLQRTLYDPNNMYAHDWQTDDIVIADNFTLLHGREAFQSRSPRHINRVQVLSDPPFENPHLDTYQ